MGVLWRKVHLVHKGDEESIEMTIHLLEDYSLYGLYFTGHLLSVLRYQYGEFKCILNFCYFNAKHDSIVNFYIL